MNLANRQKDLNVLTVRSNDECYNSSRILDLNMPFPFTLLPCEIRLEILRHALTHDTPIRTNSCHQLGPPRPTLLHLTPALLLSSRGAYEEGVPILYGENTFQAHPQILSSSIFAIDPNRTVIAPHCKALIKRWHVRVRLDCDPYYAAEEVTRCFDDCDMLEVEVFRSSWAIGGYDALEGFCGVRGVKRARVHGSVGKSFARWLEGCMMSQVGATVREWEGEEEAGFRERYWDR